MLCIVHESFGSVYDPIVSSPGCTILYACLIIIAALIHGLLHYFAFWFLSALFFLSYNLFPCLKIRDVLSASNVMSLYIGTSSFVSFGVVVCGDPIPLNVDLFAMHVMTRYSL